MDPLTHAVVGLVLGSSAGGGLSVYNGPLMAATLGAVAPDLDIIAQMWGDLTYLKQHRGFSHSLPGLGIIAAVTGGLLSFIYPVIHPAALFGWVFLGALSHTLLDLFNSYGVELLWPLSRKKWTFNLLMIFDPVLILLALATIFLHNASAYNHLSWLLFPTYIGVRWFMRCQARRLVRASLGECYSHVQIVILPSLNNLLKWDFIARIPGYDLVGMVGLRRRLVEIKHQLAREENEMNRVFTDTELGRFFCEFTPFFNLECRKEEDKLVGHFIDLRYLIRDRFLHNGTMILDEDLNVEKAVFHPFSPARSVYL